MTKPLMEFPSTVAECADLLWVVREERLFADKTAAKLKEREEAIKAHLIETLPKSEATGVAGRLARVSIVNKIVPQVKDWAKLYAYIAKTKSWELLQRRVGEGAVRERWDAGKEIPGVEHFTAVTVSINKVG